MSKPTKAERREDARLQAIRMREEQARAARRQRIIAVSLVVVVLVVLGALVAWIFSNQPKPIEIPDFSEVETPLSEVATPSTANDEGGIVVGADGVAGQAGEAADAVEVVVYADYLCPVCQTFEGMHSALLADLRESGDVVVEYRPVAILDRASAGTSYSTRSATAAALVADQAPEQFLAFNDVLFANQPGEGTRALSDEDMAALATEVGVPADVVDQIEDGSYATSDDSFVPWVTAATVQASRDFEQFGTPLILVDGENLADLGVDWRTPGAFEAVIEQARG